MKTRGIRYRIRFRCRSRSWPAVIIAFAGAALAASRAGAEAWDIEFTGNGSPASVFPQSGIINSSTYGFDTIFCVSGGAPGWLTARGNSGGLLAKDPETGNTKAGGWTVEWALLALSANPPLSVIEGVQFSDDSNVISVRYQPGQVILTDHFGSDGAAVNLDLAEEHVYRLVRQPGSGTVELYLDNDPAPAASIAPAPCSPPFCDADNLSHVHWGPSVFEAAWDYFRYHAGATAPVEEPPPQGPYQTYIVSPAVNNFAILQGKPLPQVCRSETTMSLLACRGEYEPASFLVVAATPLEDVRLEVGPLSGPAGTLPADTVDVRAVQPYFRRVTDWPATMPWLLVHDPGLFTIVEETPQWVIDLGTNATPASLAYDRINLPTREAVDTSTLQPADIVEQRQFWITVHVPANANPGAYSAPVLVAPANAPPTTLTLEVTVPSFDLLPPAFEYSVYYPAFLKATYQNPNYVLLTDTQYVNEMRNMLAHGLTNPNFYDGVRTNPDGTLDFTVLEKYIDLRKQAGMSLQGKPLYLPDNPLLIVQRDLTPAEYARNIAYAHQIVEWARLNGYGDVYFMANDEAHGAGLTAERMSFASARAGGGKIWVACYNDFFALVGDLLDRPVLFHPGAGLWDRCAMAITADLFLRHPDEMEAGSPGLLFDPAIQSIVNGVHQNGFKIFAYMDPISGIALPELHRRNRGLGLWKTGLDGTMTWAYTRIGTVNDGIFADAASGVMPDMITDFVLRGKEAPFDTLGWEGFREGVDDARYLATLLDAMEKARQAGKRAALVADTEEWLDGLSPDADLDAMRLEMTARIEALLPPTGPETWDVEWDCTGWPGSSPGIHAFPQSRGMNSSTYNSDAKFSVPGRFPGWLTANGNPGGLLGRDFGVAGPATITADLGWTLQWSFLATAYYFDYVGSEVEGVQFCDDSNFISVRYTRDGVRIRGVEGSTSVVTPIDVLAEHTYRLVRQPGGSTVELYIDENPTVAAVLTPDPCRLPYCDGGNLNHIYWVPSQFESAWDFVRLHSGAREPGETVPAPATLALLSLGGLWLMRRTKEDADG